MPLRAMAALTSAVTFDNPAARVRTSSVSWWSATGSGMRWFRDLRQSFAPHAMNDGWLNRSDDAPPHSGRWDRVSIRAAELFSAKPWSHRMWLVARGLVTRDTLQAASAMAFDLF